MCEDPFSPKGDGSSIPKVLKTKRDERAPFFRAEDTMVVRTDVGHMHAFSRPFGTCAIVKSPDPTLKGWAILETSLRDEGEILMALPGMGALHMSGQETFW